jgi:monoamine oxidase
MTLTRRGLIGAGALAAAAGAAAPGAQAQKRKTAPRIRRRNCDVVVIGAGLAGLTAAREVVKAGKSAIVLEARDRPGGRVHSHRLPNGELSEEGGTFVGPTQNRILKLADEFKIGRFDTYNTGENVYVADGERSTYSDTGPTGTAPQDPTILPDLATVVTQLDEMAKSVSVDAPWEAPNAADWDRQTLETWLRENSAAPRFRRLAAAATRPIFGADPLELSLLFVLFYIAASGDETHQGTFERNFNTREGAQMWRLEGTTQAIVDKLHEGLGRRVVLNSPVRRLVQGPGVVRVESERYTVRAKRAIVALPPALAARLDYHPLLPIERDQLTQRVGQGFLTKVACVYPTPFWRDKGLTGTAVSTDGPVNATFDDSPPGGRPGIVFGFVGGDAARGFHRMPPAERRAAVVRNFVQYFGPEAANPEDYFETAWAAEEYSRGGPVGIYGPGTMLAYGAAIRRPFGRLHWAGTETATYWNGYMDGAIRSGERAAKEVLDEL